MTLKLQMVNKNGKRLFIIFLNILKKLFILFFMKSNLNSHRFDQYQHRNVRVLRNITYAQIFTGFFIQRNIRKKSQTQETRRRKENPKPQN